jgi:hypothetical protein
MMFKKLFGNKGKDKPSSGHQPNPKEDVRIARQAFAERDLPHAFFHISWALASEPMNPEWRGLLEQINAYVDDLKRSSPAISKWIMPGALPWLISLRSAATMTRRCP